MGPDAPLIASRGAALPASASAMATSAGMADLLPRTGRPPARSMSHGVAVGAEQGRALARLPGQAEPETPDRAGAAGAQPLRPGRLGGRDLHPAGRAPGAQPQAVRGVGAGQPRG